MREQVVAGVGRGVAKKPLRGFRRAVAGEIVLGQAIECVGPKCALRTLLGQRVELRDAVGFAAELLQDPSLFVERDIRTRVVREGVDEFF